MHGIESIRQPYGFGSFVSKAFKKVGRGIKKVIKSPVGKIGLGALLASYGMGAGPFSGMRGAGFMKGPGKWARIKAMLSGQDTASGAARLIGTSGAPGGGDPGMFSKAPGILSKGLSFIKDNPALAIAGGVGLGTAAMAGKGEEEIDETIMSGKGHEDYLKMRKLWDWGGEEPMFTAADGGRVHAQQGLLATPQYGQMMEDPMSSGQGGTPNMPGLIRDESTTSQATQQTADAELIQLVKMLASMGIPMEQLRGRTKQELVELAISVQGKGGQEQEMVQAAEGGRIGLRGGGDDSIFIDESMEVLRGGEDGDVEVQKTMEEASAVDPQDALNDMSMEVFGKPLHELTPEEHQILIDMANDQAAIPNQPQEMANQPQEMINQPQEMANQPQEMINQSPAMANQGGLMRTGYAMGTEHPVIPSKDGSQLDMRDQGGYQPHGAQEKKDDVRALLAQGEFVMTSDAVKGMGGGDREAGAQKMYNLMHNMEAMA